VIAGGAIARDRDLDGWPAASSKYAPHFMAASPPARKATR
jgi:hypothetical protein